MPDEISEAEEERRGQSLAEAFQLKEVKHGDHPRNLKSYEPKRYFTRHGTKSVLGVYRVARRLVEGEGLVTRQRA